MSFTTEEYLDMIICYGMAGESARGAERLYAERHPNGRHATDATIMRCVGRSRETGSILPQRRGVNVPVRRHVNADEKVLRAFEENPGNSLRRVSRVLGIPKTTVHRIVRENGMHHSKRVQQLARDKRPLIDFCAGGNQRELARAKNLKKNVKKAASEQGSNKGLSLEQRKARDADRMREKQLKKEQGEPADKSKQAVG